MNPGCQSGVSVRSSQVAEPISSVLTEQKTQEFHT